MAALKIAMVTGLFPAVSETFVVNQILTLKEAGQKVDVFCFNKNEELLPNTSSQINDFKELDWRKFMPKPYVKRFLKIVEILIKSLTKKGVFLALLKALFSDKTINTYAFFKTYFNYYFKLEHYNVVHVHFGNNAVRLLPQLRCFDKKIIVTFHGFDIHNYDGNFYTELLGIDSINYTTNTEFAKQKLIKLGFLDSKIFVLPDGIDTALFKPNKEVHTTFNILFVGRLIELKAPLLAIQIVEKVIQKNYKTAYLTVVGDGDEFINCNKYIKENNLSQYVSLVGEKSQEKIVEYMNISDVFLFPGIIDRDGRCETQGLVLREAQAMELPVVISNVGGMKEGVLDGVTGFIAKEYDIDSFIKHLLFLMQHPKERIAMGQAGRNLVIKNYDAKILGNKLLNIYIKK